MSHLQVVNSGSSAKTGTFSRGRNNAEQLSLDVSRITVGLEALKVQTSLDAIDQLTALRIEVDFDRGQQNRDGLADRFDIATVLHRECQRALTDLDVFGQFERDTAITFLIQGGLTTAITSS